MKSLGHPDALIFLAFQQFWVRYEQGRLAELEENCLKAVAQAPGLPVLKTMLALLYCETGRRQDARSVWDGVGSSLGVEVVNHFWVMTLANGAAVCAFLGDQHRAASLYGLLISLP